MGSLMMNVAIVSTVYMNGGCDHYMEYECEAYFSIDIDTRGEIQRELLLISEFIHSN